jgi:hypothetical protein
VTMTADTECSVHQDSEKKIIHFESIPQPSAVHTDTNDVPPGYWRSYKFLGTVLAIILLANSLFIGYVMPVKTATRVSKEESSTQRFIG